MVRQRLRQRRRAEVALQNIYGEDLNRGLFDLVSNNPAVVELLKTSSKFSTVNPGRQLNFDQRLYKSFSTLFDKGMLSREKYTAVKMATSDSRTSSNIIPYGVLSTHIKNASEKVIIARNKRSSSVK